MRVWSNLFVRGFCVYLVYVNGEFSFCGPTLITVELNLLMFLETRKRSI